MTDLKNALVAAIHKEVASALDPTINMLDGYAALAEKSEVGRRASRPKAKKTTGKALRAQGPARHPGSWLRRRG